MEKVIADVIGAPNPPAAYLLVIVDLLLSHWPKSSVSAVPFVACPELLCLDRRRTTAENIQLPNLFGIKGLTREPVGLARIETLKTRTSRSSTLEQLLPYYVHDELKEQRATLHSLLCQAAKRLDAPKQKSNFSDPEFMVVHALNLIELTNWKKTEVQGDGDPFDVLEYLQPVAQSEHLSALKEASRESDKHAEMQWKIRIALSESSPSSRGFASAALKWAQDMEVRLSSSEIKETGVDETIVTAAAIAARDGGTELITENGDWIRRKFDQTFRSEDISASKEFASLQYNPVAIAFVGTAFLIQNRLDIRDVRTLLEYAGERNYAAAQGFRHVAAMLADVDERLPRAILRCAFGACVHPHQERGPFEEEDPSLNNNHQMRIAASIDAELCWLAGEREEPEWPLLEPYPASSRYGLSRLVKGSPNMDRGALGQRTDVQAAGLWLRSAVDLSCLAQKPWLRNLANVYSGWTTAANGSTLAENEEPGNSPTDWNQAYFELLANCLPGLERSEIDRFALEHILCLPEQSFLDATAVFLRKVDAVYFNNNILHSDAVITIRSILAERLIKTRRWNEACRRRSDSTELHLGIAIATMLFNNGGGFQAPECYLQPAAIERVQPFLPVLQNIVESGPLIIVAMAMLNLLEVAPEPAHLPIIATAARVWRKANPGNLNFWRDLSVGRRMCVLIDTIRLLDPSRMNADSAARSEIDALLTSLIALGLPEAHRLEEALRTNS